METRNENAIIDPATDSDPGYTEWSLRGFVEEFGGIDTRMPERRFVFVLGAGASKASDIPIGIELIDIWLTELRERDAHHGVGAMEEWATATRLRIEGFTYANRAAFYPQVYARRFEHDPESGYAYLEKLISGKEPSFGYCVLAHILEASRHKLVVTTNFDNLVADALSIFTDTAPLVVGHESLATFCVPEPRRPVVAKVHRDLLLRPKNRPDELESLDGAWQSALVQIFHQYCPIVIGYGGNDGSLMGFLESLDPARMPGALFWCQYATSPVDPRTARLLARCGGILVRIGGFDELMLVLSERLGYESLEARLEEKTQARVKSVNEQLADLKEKLQRPDNYADAESLELARVAMSNMVDRDINRLQKETERATDLGALANLGRKLLFDEKWDDAEGVFLELLELNTRLGHTFPKALTHSNLGRVYLGKKDYAEAERHLQSALQLEVEAEAREGQAIVLGTLGTLYEAWSRPQEAAKCYASALQLDEELGRAAGVVFNAGRLGKISRRLRDLPTARRAFLRAAEAAEAEHNMKYAALYLGNLGSVCRDLGDLAHAKDYYRRALRLSEELGNRAGIAITHDNLGVIAALQGHPDEASQHFLKSLWLDETSGNPIGIGKSRANLGVINWHAGRDVDATTEWDKANEIFARFDLKFKKKLEGLREELTRIEPRQLRSEFFF